MFKPKKKLSNPQLSLGIKEPFTNRLVDLKNKAAMNLLYFETKRFIRHPLMWFFVILTMTNLAIQLYFLNQNYAILPNQVPFFLYQANIAARLIPSWAVIGVPIFTLFSTIIVMIVSERFFNKDQNLSILVLLLNFLNTSLLSFAILLCIAPYYG